MSGKYGYTKRVSSKRKFKKLKHEMLFKSDFPDVFIKMKGIGYDEKKALEKVKEISTPLGRLIQRYELNVNKPGVAAISLDDIRRTSKVDDWIEDMVEQGLLKDKGSSLMFPADAMLGRYLVNEWE